MSGRKPAIHLGLRFLLVFLTSLCLALQGSPVLAIKIYSELELRSLGIHFVEGQNKNSQCKATVTSDATDSEDPTIDNALANNITTDRFATIDQKIVQTFIIGFPADTSAANLALIKRIVQTYHPGGIVIQGPADGKTFNKAFFDNLNDLNGTPMIIAVDQAENARDMGKMNAADVEALGKTTGAGLSSLGVNVDLAPVLDLDNGTTTMSTQGRSFSADPNIVISAAGAYAKGLNEGGIKPVFRHFPGQGNASGAGDPNSGIVTTPSLDSLKIKDLVPYQQLVNQASAAVMLGNLVVPGLSEDGKTPASISTNTVKLLRDGYSFGGMITTDNLAAEALKQQGVDLPNAIQRSLSAGVDAPLFSYTSEADLQSAIKFSKASVSPERIDAALTQVVTFKNARLTTTAAPAVTAPAAGVTSGPAALGSGSKIFILGDSITLSAKDEYQKIFDQRNLTLDLEASSGRSINGAGQDGDKLSGMDEIAKFAASIASSDAVVIALGTNAGESAVTVDAAYEAIKAINPKAALDHHIYWVDTITIGRPEYTATTVSNASIYAEASAKGYTVISWANKVDPKSTPANLTGKEEDPNKFILPYEGQSKKDQAASLGVHPTPAGKSALATLVTDALQNGSAASIQTASGCCTVATVAPEVNASGQVIGTFYGAQKTLPADWIPVLKAAGEKLSVDPSFLAALLGVESSWTPLEAFVQNPELDHHPGGAAGPFQFEPGTAAPLRSNLELDGNKDGVVDEKNPYDAAYMAAALLKSMQATLTTPLGDAGDYGVAKNNSDGKVTVRTIAAHYNQGGAFTVPNGSTKEQANALAKFKNKTGDYMDMVSENTDAVRKSGIFAGTTGATDPSTSCNKDSSGKDPTSDADFVVYSQYDKDWADNTYGILPDGTKSTIKAGGCGPSAMAMAITFLTGNQVTPADTAAYGVLNGTQDTKGGSSGNIATIMAPHWQLKATPIKNDVTEMNTAMQSGGLIIIAGQGTTAPWTEGGHYILIRGLTANNKWKIGDSNLPGNNTIEFDPTALLVGAVAGSAFVISKP